MRTYFVGSLSYHKTPQNLSKNKHTLANTLKALVIQSTGKEYLVKTDKGAILNCVARGKFRQKGIKSTNPITVGDWVDLDSQDGKHFVITHLHERRNYMLRKSVKLSKQTQIIAANIDRVCFIFSVKSPETNLVFVDRFLAICESYNLPVLLVFNKWDLLDETNQAEFEKLRKLYEQIGYQTLATSAMEKESLNSLQTTLKQGVSVLVGNSGVGKSSLINAISPNLDIKTGSISTAHDQGKHTTIFARMYELDFGGQVIDTPGIRGIDFYNESKELIHHYFKELFEHASACKFHNCIHLQEPQCAVKKALEEEQIAASRYESYLKIIQDLGEKYR